MFRKITIGFRWTLIAIIVIIAGWLMLKVSRSDSAIIEEPINIAAGYSHLRYLDYRLNPEQPPLAKIIAALPLVFKNYIYPKNDELWTDGINQQWQLGQKFLYESGNNADGIIIQARLAPILLTLLFIILIYLWAKELIGRWWALLPTFLFAFSPTVLAHGHYVTTDMAAALSIFVTTWSFTNFLHKPSRSHLILTGLFFGAAQLIQFSTAILAPYFIMLVIVYFASEMVRDWALIGAAERYQEIKSRLWHYVKSLFLIFIIGYALVYVVYLVFTLNYPIDKQITDTEFLLKTFNPHWLTNFTIWLAKNPILRPWSEYLLGWLTNLQSASSNNAFYFLGTVSSAAHWYYLPIVFLMKEPLPSLILILTALAVGLFNFLKDVLGSIFKKSGRILDYLTTNFPEFAMAAFVIFYGGYSILKHSNPEMRLMLPVLPFIYILASDVVKRWFSLENTRMIRNFLLQLVILAHELAGISVKALILVVLLVWYLAGTLIAYPYFLSYYNLAVGGTSLGYKYTTASNYDWGQDLKRLKSWAEKNLPKSEKIAIDYFGGGSPKYYLGEERVQLWRSSKGNPIMGGIKWLAVSINILQSAKGALAPGQQRQTEDEYLWLEKVYEPFARAGTSIFIYNLEEK